MLHFSNPIALWALSGLLIPIAIHLLSRKEGKVIRFGSLRHLQDSNTARFKSLRLNEIFLLALRCLLLALMVLFIAGLRFNRPQKEKQKWLVVESGIENAPRFKTLHDSLKAQGYQVRYLANGFPDYDSAGEQQKNYWLLVEELKNNSVNEVVVASYSYAKNFKGERAGLPENIRWISFEPTPSEIVVKATDLGADSVMTRTGTTTANATSLITKKHKIPVSNKHYFMLDQDSVQLSKRDSITITIVYDQPMVYDQKIIRACLQAIQGISPHQLVMNTLTTNDWNPEQQQEWLILLTEKPHPAEQHKTNGKVIALKKCEGGNLPLLMHCSASSFSCAPPNHALWVITKRLNEDVALKESLTLSLAKIILEEPLNAFYKKDRRVCPEDMMWSRTASAISPVSTRQHSEPYLAALILITLLTERLLAYKRNQ